uniref:Pleckstrin homology domain containing, family M (with RUN domain) member 1 n=1 Tax=Sphaeramia orbicularis TaxID=375764 RepID=A0A673ACI6_9TELE
MPDAPSEAKDVKQIKEKLALSLKALQKRFVTSDAVVTSEDEDANLLCCALEAIFIHGIKSKYIGVGNGSRGRKGDRKPLPQPVFWSLLKTVTHRDVITELEKLAFVSTDVGRCRAWLRLALNHGLLECYLASLFRENSKLQAHYQPSALLLNMEEREVLLSYLQGLGSLTFSLSYKSAVLKEWTTTPLALAGLCPLSQAETLEVSVNGGVVAGSKPVYKESWDTMSQSSGSSDALDMLRGCPVLQEGSGSGVLPEGRTGLSSSNLSLDTTGSSQLSSSLSSDSLLQGQDPRSPSGEQWSSSDLEVSVVNTCTRRPQKEYVPFFVVKCDRNIAYSFPNCLVLQIKTLLLFVLQHSRSWISEDDIYKPHLEEMSDQDEVAPSALGAQAPEPKVPPSPPSVVHRRQIGLSNPFRGLLKLGHLERRGAMGMWRDYYCELSPFEFRLYLNAEERTCCDNCSLVRCEEARITSPEGRFELAFPGKRLYLRAANHDEAEDWVDRIVEAVNKCRPASRFDDQWEVLQHPCENAVDELASPTSAPSSPERGFSSCDSGISVGQDAPPPQAFEWTRTVDLETDAIKESVLYLSTDPEARTWVPLVFSLSLEALKGFKVQEGRKFMRLNHSIEEIRDVVPDVSLGGPACFKVLTIRETLRLRAENGDEARLWRVLIRGALDSYLESGEDGASEEPVVARLEMAGNLHRLVQHRLKEDGTLLSHLCTVPSEKGLDSQNFKCAGCPQQIGPSLGRARLCEFSGQYYCDSCHQGDTTIIPSRMVHNWDLTRREVSKRALRLLAQVEQEPLLNLEQLNPELVKHAESMAQAHSLRQKLRLLGDYLLICRSGAWKKLQAVIGQRSYLLESSHLYSVMDLRQIAEGQYVTFLITMAQYASNHVFQCDLCTQRGFICQTCHSNEIIFPFQFESTTRCQDCKAVFHLACKAPGQSCPRCLRMKKYLERDLQD